MRIDRLINKSLRCGSKATRQTLASRQVEINGDTVVDHDRIVAPFDHVRIGDQILRNRTPRYIALHKPAGIVSATTDSEHRTVIDLIGEEWADDLHLAGRLDRFTTGLVILTNDSRFSEFLTLPEKKTSKTYLVDTDRDISPEAVHAFQTGMPFAKENITTAPAKVTLLTPRQCRLTIYEGKHHQVKRMFLRFDTKVTALHRESIGPYTLGDLPEGEWREFKPQT